MLTRERDGVIDAPAGPVIAALDRPRGPDTSLLVLADVHADAAREPGSWKCHHVALDRLHTALAEADHRGDDAVLVAGDLTRDGGDDSFDAVASAFAAHDTPVYCVPGNHDVPKDYRDAPSVHAFRDRFTPGVLPYVRRVGGVHVVGLDSASAVTDGAGGRVTAAQRERLAEALRTLDETVVVLHHNVVTDGDAPMRVDRHPPVGGADELAAVLRDGDVPLVLSGHGHWPTVGEHSGVREVVAPAVCSFPQAALRCSITPRGTTVSLVPLADREGLESAYRAARDGTDHSRRIAERFRDGYLAYFPLVDDRAPASDERDDSRVERVSDP